MAREKCPNCGKFIAPNASFCVFCSHILKTVEDNEQDTAREEVSPSQGKPAALSKEANPEPSSNQEPINLAQNTGESDFEYQENFEEEEDDEEARFHVDEKERERMNRLLHYTSDAPLPEGPETSATQVHNQASSESNFPSQKAKVFSQAASQAMQLKEKMASRRKEDPGDPEPIPKTSQRITPTKQESIPIHEQSVPEPISENKDSVPHYDPNHDQYYDNVIAYVDAKIEYLAKERVVKTIGLVTGSIILIGFFIYFLL